MKKLFLLFTVFTVIFVSSLNATFNASANVQAGHGQKRTSGTATIGSVVIDGITYQKIAIQPIIKIKKFSAGLDLRFYIDSKNKLKDSDGNGKPDGWETWRDWVSKILFIQYAQKGAKPVYARMGNINNAELGHGFIMDRFSNSLNTINSRRIGMQFDMNLSNFGFESITDDITKFDIVGVRPFFMPLSHSSVNLLNKLTVAATFVTDRNVVSNFKEIHFGFNKNQPDADKDGIIDKPYVKYHNLNIPDSYVDKVYNNPYDTAYNRLKNKALQVYGFDIGTELFHNAVLKARLYGDFAKIRDYGSGFAFPGIEGTLFSLLRLKAEYRSYDSDFIPSIFDAYYESKRMQLENGGISTIFNELDKRKNGARVKGGFFKIDYANSKYFYFIAAYENYLNAKPRIYGTVEVRPAFFMLYSNQRLGVRFSYEQTNLAPIKQFTFLNENTIVRTVLTYGVSANVAVKYVYLRTFNSYGKSTTSTSIEMSMKF